jgi:hypothetical protein
MRHVEVCWGVHPWELASSFPTPYRLTWLIWSRCTQPKGLHPRRLHIKLCHILLQHVLCSLNAWWDFQTDCFHVRLAVLGSTLADHLQRFSKFLEILHGVKRFSTPGPKLPTRPQCSPSLGITSGPLYYVNVVITGTTLLHKSRRNSNVSMFALFCTGDTTQESGFKAISCGKLSAMLPWFVHPSCHWQNKLHTLSSQPSTWTCHNINISQ